MWFCVNDLCNILALPLPLLHLCVVNLSFAWARLSSQINTHIQSLNKCVVVINEINRWINEKSGKMDIGWCVSSSSCHYLWFSHVKHHHYYMTLLLANRQKQKQQQQQGPTRNCCVQLAKRTMTASLLFMILRPIYAYIFYSFRFMLFFFFAVSVFQLPCLITFWLLFFL